MKTLFATMELGGLVFGCIKVKVRGVLYNLFIVELG